jgi:PAS domain S-box-containing protein
MDSRLYKPFLILFILQLCLISSCNLIRSEKNYPYAVKGVIDLTGWNFAKDGPLDLKGEWEFYWHRHLRPADFAKAATPRSPDFRQVPDFWNNYRKDGGELPGEGFATFRLTVLVNGKQKQLALRLMEISTAYTLFVNGRHLASAGVPGSNRETTVPKQYRQVVEFEHDTDQLEIILHVSNFHHKKGGVWEVIQLGSKKDLRLSQDRRLGIDLFLFGSIVIMGLYHLGLFAVRRRNPSPLYFSIFCFLIALRLFTIGERFLIHLYPAISWKVVTKLEYLSFWLVVPAFCLFMQSLFPKFSKRILYTIGILGLVFSIAALATPARLYTQFNNIYQAITLLTIIYSLYVIFISFTEKRTEGFVFLVGFTVLALMTINDILYVEGIIETGFLVPFGVFAFIFSQASLLSFRFSNALTTVEAQGRELKDTLESYKEEIVQRVQTEEALRASEEKYRTILHSIEDGYYEVDLNGNLTFFNDSLCTILGYPKDELLGMNNGRFMSEKAAGQVWETFNEVYRSGNAAKALDWEMIRKDGSKIFVEASVSLIRDPEGEPIGFRGVARDITDRKHAEEQAKLHQQQLMQASKMVALGTLVSGVAHEINNPNNFIMLNSPILKEAWENVRPIVEQYYKENGDFVLGGMNYSEMRDNIPDLFSGIAEGAGRIKQIVDDLKNYVRDDTADLTQEVDVNAVLTSAISLVHNMITTVTHRFEIDYGKNLPPLQGNFQRLEQVVINLIQNACQALPSADRGIYVTTCYDEEASNIIIRVHDEGAGIAQKTLSRITDPFFTTRHNSGGVGLGLSISSRIIEEHGGSMRFRSEPGDGTTVEIILPVDS